MAVLCRKICHVLRRHCRKGRVGHIDQVAVLIFAIHAVQPDAVHLPVAPVQIFILAVGVTGIPEIELQRIVIILAEIHQRIHFLGGERVLCHDAALAVHHAGTVAGDGVVEPDAAQLPLEADARISAAGAEHESAACGLQLLHRLDHLLAGLALAKGHQCIVIIACQNLILHSFLPYGTSFVPVYHTF